jgi:hypothetical protein
LRGIVQRLSRLADGDKLAKGHFSQEHSLGHLTEHGILDGGDFVAAIHLEAGGNSPRITAQESTLEPLRQFVIHVAASFHPRHAPIEKNRIVI